MLHQMQGTVGRLLYGSDRASEKQRTNSVATTGRSNSTTSASSFEKADYHDPFNEKDDGITQSTTDVPSTPSETELHPARKVSWPTLLRSPTLYSLPPTFSRIWRRELDCEPTWEPSLLQLRPLAGLLGLLVSICCIFASLAILMVSDRQPIDNWPIEPTVYLAIVAAIANSALHLARAQAIPVSWWYQAAQGRTIRVLERQWEVSQSLMRALLHSRHMSLVTIACICTSFVIIDGPLLQRASSVVPATTQSNVTLHVVLPPELPKGFSGFDHDNQIWFSKAFWQSSQEWMKNTAITLSAPECDGTVRTLHK